jgi:carbamoyltransferase
MDGLDAISRAHGRTYDEKSDRFYTSAVENSLAFFAEQRVHATYFVIAADLENPEKRPAIESVVRAGHNVACHGYRHRYLNRISAAEKREEIFTGKKRIEDVLGVECIGFRAPGYSLDFDSLGLLGEAGFRYDSSVFPSYEFRQRLGLQRLFPEPFTIWPESGLVELPMPYVGPYLPPFHPCYAFYLGRGYYNSLLRAFGRKHNYLTLLYHLTDFADPVSLRGGLGMQLFTNNFFSRQSKLDFLRELMKPLREGWLCTTSEELVRGWPGSAPDLNPRTVLGISTTHETGACVVRDGKIISAINEERITRKKLDNRYPPVDSIREAIRLAGIAPQEIEAVAISGLHWRDLVPQTLAAFWQDVRDFHSWNDYFPHFCRTAYRMFYLWRAAQYAQAPEFLQREYGITPRVVYVDHHESHAASVHLTDTGKEALVVTADGVGDDLCVTFNRARGGAIRRLEALFYPHSFGQFYTACTQILGFKGGRHEGKITGLSGFGKPNPQLLAKLEKTFFCADGGFRLHKRYYAEGFLRLRWKDIRGLLRGKFDILNVDYRNYKPPLKRLLAGHSREEVAHAFQLLMEREVVRLARKHAGDRPVRLELAGGVFANVKLNMAMGRGLNAESVFIFPNMGDGGLGVGAALSVAGVAPRPVPNMYLGTGYSEEEILRAIGQFPEVTHERPASMAEAVAEALATGKIVARFDGAMEYGPRALGNRSILYHCADKTVNDWLNQRLRRTEFMPFAPMCIWEDAADYFDIRPGEMRACEFMTYVTPCTPRMQNTCPAAVHVDGTARPQLVRRDLNAAMYDILQAYKKRTGVSCVINTSFNMHEEPIVRSPEDAITAFRQSELDILVLGPFLVRERKAPAAAETHELQETAAR